MIVLIVLRVLVTILVVFAFVTKAGMDLIAVYKALVAVMLNQMQLLGKLTF